MATETLTVRSKPRSTVRMGEAASAFARWAILLVLAAIVVIPVLYAVLGGFKDNYQLSAAPMALPDPWLVENYTDVLVDGTFWQQLINSLVIAVITTVTVVGLASLAAFAFARRRFPGRETLFTLFTLGLLFPSAVAILPLFILIRTLGLLDSPLGIALPQAAFALPLTLIILRPFFRSVPVELEDAAQIDGCSSFGFFWRVLLPLARPALATVAVLAVVTSWNQFLLPLVILSDQANWTLPLGVTNFSTQYSSDTARILAYTSLSMIPALGFYVVAERQLVGGLTTGGVKG
jgi:raffinose/stachyose/melibiose transport system permease protein